MNNSYLPALIEKAIPIPDQFQSTFGQLNQNQFNWKPSAKEWSVGECISHLIATNQCYFPKISRIVNGDHRNSVVSKIPGLSALWGRMLLNMVSPNIKKKVKTLRSFEPDSSNINISLLDDFDRLQAITNRPLQKK